jgi:VanZ family protein
MPVRIDPRIRGACFAVALAVTAVILYESTQERGRPGVPDVSTNLAYLGHFATYTLLTICGLIALNPRSMPAFVIVLALAVSLGAGLEAYQIHLSTRTASVGDALADAAGALSAVTAYVALALMLDSSKRGRPTRV